MKRTQLYLDDDLWAALHARARLEGSTVSELVRQAARERYMGNLEKRKAAMLRVIGLWNDRTDLDDTEGMIRRLRSGTRMERIQGAESRDK